MDRNMECMENWVTSLINLHYNLKYSRFTETYVSSTDPSKLEPTQTELKHCSVGLVSDNIRPLAGSNIMNTAAFHRAIRVACHYISVDVIERYAYRKCVTVV